MSEEIKYKAEYGLQKPFDYGPEDATAYGMFGNEILYYKIEKTSVYCFDTDNQWSHIDGAPNIPFLAMRRIIKEPKRWTWEDKKAGRLPEVGSLIMEVESQYGFEFVGVCAGSKRFAVKDVLDGLIYFYNKDVISPIETKAEKAQRLEDEFINYVLHHEKSQINSSEELIAAKRAIKLAYKLQLSGELQAPKGGE